MGMSSVSVLATRSFDATAIDETSAGEVHAGWLPPAIPRGCGRELSVDESSARDIEAGTAHRRAERDVTEGLRRLEEHPVGEQPPSTRSNLNISARRAWLE